MMRDIRHGYSAACATGANGCTAARDNLRVHANETRVEVFAYFANDARASVCARGPVHGMRRILRSFPELRGVKLTKLVIGAHVSYFGTDS